MALSQDRQSSNASIQARAAIVNRTHRVVRERAAAMQERKRRTQDLVVPFAVLSVMLIMIASAVWSLTDETMAGRELGVWKRVMEFGGDAGSTMSILLVWFLPLSVITAAVILLRRGRSRGGRH